MCVYIYIHTHTHIHTHTKAILLHLVKARERPTAIREGEIVKHKLSEIAWNMK